MVKISYPTSATYLSLHRPRPRIAAPQFQAPPAVRANVQDAPCTRPHRTPTWVRAAAAIDVWEIYEQYTANMCWWHIWYFLYYPRILETKFLYIMLRKGGRTTTGEDSEERWLEFRTYRKPVGQVVRCNEQINEGGKFMVLFDVYKTLHYFGPKIKLERGLDKNHIYYK